MKTAKRQPNNNQTRQLRNLMRADDSEPTPKRKKHQTAPKQFKRPKQPKQPKPKPPQTRQLRNLMRVDDSEPTRRAAFDALRSVGPFVAARFCDIVRARNELARLCGYEDFYDMKAGGGVVWGWGWGVALRAALLLGFARRFSAVWGGGSGGFGGVLGRPFLRRSCSRARAPR